LRELPIVDGWNICDNNLLACSDNHLDSVFSMLSAQRKPAEFSGGLEAERVTDGVIERLKGIRLGQLFLAYDAGPRWRSTLGAIGSLRAAGLTRHKIRCFVLCGFGKDTIEDATDRCQQVLDAGAFPFAMLFQGPEVFVRYSREWRAFQRQWTRPALMFARKHE
jgi:hypothetical protein